MLLSVVVASSSAIAVQDDFLSVRSSLGLPTDATADSNGASAGNGSRPQMAPYYKDTSAPPSEPDPFSYGNRPVSKVFGDNLFSGAFARGGAASFNPEYVVSIGDKIHVRLWGAFQFDSSVTVDAKGNVFLPNVGPIRLAGVKNMDIQKIVDKSVRQVYQKNVLSYANLEAAQPVRVFVGGFVRRPGLYNGTSMDSLLHYLDQAGGIDPDRGSYLDVQVKRGDNVRAHIDLYQFLLRGDMPLVQFSDGDVVFVPPLRNTVSVGGLVENAKRFEFSGPELRFSQLVSYAKPYSSSTHIRLVRNTGTELNVEYYPLSLLRDLRLYDEDEIEFVADKKPGTITVRVEGEHQSAQEYVLPYGSRVGELLRLVEFSDRSDMASMQLFRRSVQERQKEILETTLNNLERAVLTARSGTREEAQLRTEEAALVLQWVERAKSIEPLGQVIITKKKERDQLLLENGDVIKVPTKDGLVVVSGEVLFPTAITFDPGAPFEAYIKAVGGYSQNADSSRVVLAHRDGTFEEVDPDDGVFSSGTPPKVRSGDQILVLPKVDVKSRQIAKELTQILYQIAISTGVVLGL